MPTRDPLQVALAKITALEAELAEWRGSDGNEPAARQRAEAEVADLKREMEELREQHEAQLAQQKAQHRAQLEAASVSTIAQIERARVQGELQSAQLQAALVEQDTQSYLERLNALAAELSEEIDVLLSFSREEAAEYYTQRTARESEALKRVEAAHHAARRALAQKEAEARATGQRTITQMSEIDAAIERARVEAHAAGVAARDSRTRLDSLQKKLERCATK